MLQDSDLSALKLAFLRDEYVALDADLARFFGVKTGQLNQAVTRNPGKFTPAYCFRIAEEEVVDLISQNVISKSPGHGGSRHLPRVFTERGVVMLASVLRSDRAVEAAHIIVDVFVAHWREYRESRVNRPFLVVDTDAQSATSPSMRTALQSAFAGIVDRLGEPAVQSKLAQDAQAIMGSAVSHLKARLETAGLENERTVAEIGKLLAETETERARTRQSSAAAELERLHVVERRLALLIALDHYLENRSATDFVELLSAMRPS